MIKKEPEYPLITERFLGTERTLTLLEDLIREGKQFTVVPDNLSWAVTFNSGPSTK